MHPSLFGGCKVGRSFTLPHRIVPCCGNMSSEAKNSDLVTFDVGGKIYKVLREPTLSLHPNSLLTQIAEEQKDDKPIFVEGDQDLFKFVIDYHRDRKVLLPITVSIDAVVRELKRFGLEPTSEQIQQDGVAFPSMMQRVDRELAKWQKVNASRKRKLTDDLLGVMIAEVAPRKMQEAKGGRFEVGKQDLPGGKEHFQSFFGTVQVSDLNGSVPLKDFAKSFGYKFENQNHWGNPQGNGPWTCTVFAPA